MLGDRHADPQASREGCPRALLRAGISRVRAAHYVEPTERLHERLQGARADSADQGDGEARRIPRPVRKLRGGGMLTYSRYKFTRFWAVYDDGKLLCVTVYLKGAMAVVELVNGIKPEPPKRKKAEKKRAIPPK